MDDDERAVRAASDAKKQRHWRLRSDEKQATSVNMERLEERLQVGGLFQEVVPGVVVHQVHPEP